jgi:hypothetical protein
MAKILVTGDVNLYASGNWIDWYHELSRDSDELVITAGCSWTWGKSLSPKTRTKEIYGHLISEKLNADFINIGLQGGDNISIINVTERILLNLQKKYEKIYVIVTLTEDRKSVV